MSSPDRTNEAPSALPALVSNATLAALQTVAYVAHTILFRAGDADDQLYVILAGEIALVDGLGTKDERLREIRGAGELVGEMSVLQVHRPHRFSARVHADAQLLELHRDDVDAVLRHEPLLAYELLQVATAHMHRSYHRAMRTMQEKNTQLAEAYTALEHAQAQLLTHERVQHELRLAREIQERMLPAALPTVEGIDLGARIIPAHEVGGDFFDIFLLDDETLGLVIGDVCGKGMPAALYMAQTRSLIRAEAAPSTMPDIVLRRVNRHLRELNAGEMFATVVYGSFHCPTRTFVAARAGHEYPLHWAADGTEPSSTRAIGQPLGLLADPVLDLQTHTLTPGSTLLLYTDGIPEAVNEAGAFFTREALRAAVRSARALSAQGLCDHLVQTLAVYQGTMPQADDITLVVVRVD